MASGAAAEKKRVLAVVGPTGSGKSALAMELAEALGGEIVSCDSVQVYRGFDVGAAKPTPAEQARVRHHLIDVVDWNADYDAALYAKDATAAIADAQARGRVPIVCGGTGLYLRALLQRAWHDDLPKDEALRETLRAETTEALHAKLAALDPARAAALHPNDRFRVIRAIELATLLGRPSSELRDDAGGEPSELARAAHVIVLDPPRAALHRSIEARAAAMLAGGLVDEVKALLAQGVDPDCKPMRSIGYKQVVDVLTDQSPAAELEAKICAATRQYAKRQTTWFKGVPAAVRAQEWRVAEILAGCREALSG